VAVTPVSKRFDTHMTTKSHALDERVRVLARRNPAFIAAAAYAALSLVGAFLLASTFTAERGAQTKASFLDALFISTSAVSTTGLVTLDPATTFNFWGEFTILALLQVGGIGYMTLMSFAYMALRERLSPAQTSLVRSGFGLTQDIGVGRFIRHVIVFTIIIEAIGAALLYLLFVQAGTADAGWNAIFHSISAFCTAGFSLFATSLEGYRDNPSILYVITLLSYAGALGFVLLEEVTDWVRRRRLSLSATTRLILKVTFGLGLAGSLFLFFFEPSISSLPLDTRIANAVFQAMTASTTVGFNSVPIGALAPSAIVVMYLLMFVGASPSGTGGGLKTTTTAVLVATALSSLTGRSTVTTAGIALSPRRLIQAAGTLVAALLIVFIALMLLTMTGDYPFEKALFEVLSALGTVGLSMGITGSLNDAGKAIITAVMYIGRVGILTFFVAFALSAPRVPERAPEQGDVIL
jgi:trk system potassium uptake protein